MNRDSCPCTSIDGCPSVDEVHSRPTKRNESTMWGFLCVAPFVLGVQRHTVTMQKSMDLERPEKKPNETYLFVPYRINFDSMRTDNLPSALLEFR
jgi:hypothetical protein